MSQHNENEDQNSTPCNSNESTQNNETSAYVEESKQPTYSQDWYQTQDEQKNWDSYDCSSSQASYNYSSGSQASDSHYSQDTYVPSMASQQDNELMMKALDEYERNNQ